MIKLNVGDLVEVKPPETEKEKKNYVKGLGYIKEKHKNVKKYDNWISIQWMDEPVEIIKYSKSEVEFLMKDWNIYPVLKVK